jgi:hypothetical protein
MQDPEEERFPVGMSDDFGGNNDGLQEARVGARLPADEAVLNALGIVVGAHHLARIVDGDNRGAEAG